MALDSKDLKARMMAEAEMAIDRLLAEGSKRARVFADGRFSCSAGRDQSQGIRDLCRRDRGDQCLRGHAATPLRE